MNFIRFAAILSVFFLIAGCGSVTPTLSLTGDVVKEPLEEGCPIRIYTTKPKKDFDELGVIDIEYYCMYGCPDNNTANGVKEIVAKDVCKAGGNAILLWEANGFGFYTKVTVIHVN